MNLYGDRMMADIAPVPLFIPEVFYGTTQQVRSRMRKIVTQLRKGKSLSAIMESFSVMNIQDHPEALIWLAAFWSQQSGEHFRVYQLGNALASDERLEWEDVNRIREESLEYLASTPWGVLALNCPQQYYWVRDYPINKTVFKRESFIAILQGISDHWTLYENLGTRFYIGAIGGLPFQYTRPLADFVFANCDLDRVYSQNLIHRNLARLCEESGVIERLTTDDEYWTQICERRRLEYESPPASTEG